MPPVMIAKRRQRSGKFWQEAFTALPPERVAQIRGVRPRAFGWSIVTVGAAFLATNETWELAEQHEWPVWSFLLIVSVLGALAVLNAIISTAQRHENVGAELEASESLDQFHHLGPSSLTNSTRTNYGRCPTLEITSSASLS